MDRIIINMVKSVSRTLGTNNVVSALFLIIVFGGTIFSAYKNSNNVRGFRK